jgi:hypothetical protein
MANITTKQRVERINDKFNFFVKQTSGEVSDYLSAATVLNELRIEMSGGCSISQDRLVEIEKKIDTIFANLRITYQSQALM